MGNTQSWRMITACAGVLVVLSLLASTPSMIVPRNVSFIDTELREAGPAQQEVLARMDFADPDALAAIPRELGAWEGIRDYEWDRVVELLKPEAMFSRDYVHPSVFQPVNLLVIQSGDTSSFHPAPVCYRYQGWTVPEAGNFVPVPVTNMTWAREGWLSADEPRVFNGTVTAKQLVVTRETDGNHSEKRAALYVYVKQQDWRVTDSLVWIRVEMALASTSDGTWEAAIMGELLSEAIPFMFEVPEPEDTLAETVYARFGYAGAAGLAITTLAPAAVAVPWNRLTRRRD